jgi:hypothetical protein
MQLKILERTIDVKKEVFAVSGLMILQKESITKHTYSHPPLGYLSPSTRELMAKYGFDSTFWVQPW